MTSRNDDALALEDDRRADDDGRSTPRTTRHARERAIRETRAQVVKTLVAAEARGRCAPTIGARARVRDGGHLGDGFGFEKGTATRDEGRAGGSSSLSLSLSLAWLA
jgi:hypothetical protein